MKIKAVFFLLSIILLSCGSETVEHASEPTQRAIAGTWQLVSGTVIEQGDTMHTDYTKGVSFIKVINDTHFAFLQHDLKQGKDSAVFVAGGGRYTLTDSLYTEHLEYCSARDWEGNDFAFTIAIAGDSLLQKGTERVERAGVDRVNIEKYIRVKK